MGPRAVRGAVDSGVKHSFIAFGPNTYMVSEHGETLWESPEHTRDGWLLPSGNVLMVVTRVAGKHGGRVIEVTKAGKEVFRYEGTQQEVNTAQPLANGHILLTEAGANPRILELDRSGKTVFELKLDCQNKDAHTQSRMTRKLKNGNYLVPLMTEQEVREYTPAGKVVWRAKTPNWPFTAIRLPNGNSLITGTRANAVFEFDRAAKLAWSVSNNDVTGEPYNGVCGGQRLPNGNTVATSYRARANDTKMIEVNRDKEVVWTYTDERPHGIHHFQILTTNGEKTPQPLLR